MAHAVDISTTTPAVAATLGSTAKVVFDFDFGASTSITSFNLDLNFNPSALQFDPAQSFVTFNGLSGDPATVFPGYTTVADPVLGLTVAWMIPVTSPVPSPLPSVPLSGKAELTLAYSVLFPAGSSPVELVFAFSDGNGDDGVVNYLSPNSTSAISNITVTAAVPEPETWAMMFAGLSLVALFARRRAVQRQA